MAGEAAPGSARVSERLGKLCLVDVFRCLVLSCCLVSERLEKRCFVRFAMASIDSAPVRERERRRERDRGREGKREGGGRGGEGRMRI